MVIFINLANTKARNGYIHKLSFGRGRNVGEFHCHLLVFVETRTYCIYKVYSGSIRYYWQSNPAIEGLKKGAGSGFNSVDIDKFSFSMCASA